MTSILDRMKRDKMEIAAIKRPDGTPGYYAVTPDQMTAIELTGDPAHFTRIALAGVMSNRHLAATSRNGAWAALLLALAIPEWKDGQKWLAGRIRALRQASDVQISRDGWQSHLTFTQATGMMTLQFVRA
jgi:hypothetical protein